MGSKINKKLTTKSGLKLPVNNVVISSIHFPKPTVSENEEGDKVYTRIITYDLFNYITIVEVKTVSDNYVNGGVVEFGGGYEKKMTDAEYNAILADGSLAEVWLKEYLDGILGADSCTIINPYI